MKDLPLPPYPAAVDRMAGTLTQPFAAGADRIDLEYVGGEPGTSDYFADYDFAEHRARFGTEPRPRYIVRVLQDIETDITMTVYYTVPGSREQAPVRCFFPAGTLAGTSVLVPLGADAATAVLARVALRAPQGEKLPAVRDTFRFTALLGDLAALLWVLGGERDTLGAHLQQARRQKSVAEAVGLSLDLIGSDLDIPRFPPLPYGYTSDTIALYHLDDDPTTTTVADATKAYAGKGHSGTRTNCKPGVDGRFGSGMGFTDGQSEILVDDDPAFALPVVFSANFTAECFVRPAPGPWTGAVLSKITDPAGPGWSLSIGNFRGRDRDIRLLLSDGSKTVTVDAGVSLNTDRYQHVAAVFDRSRKRARLYVDGALVASTAADLGALTSTSPLRIGSTGPAGDGRVGFYGSLDEVRITRNAQSSFAPVLGEDDESYRKRLTLFRSWNLPTPANIAEAVNSIVGEIGGIGHPITLSDAFVRTPVGAHTLTIRPATLPVDRTIDARGRSNTTEEQICGTRADDQFDPRLLVSYDNASVDAVGGERRIRQSMVRYLDRLIELVGQEPGFDDARLNIAMYDPKAEKLRAVGRAVLITHRQIAADRLAALAHRAGFSWVWHVANVGVYASIADRSTIEIVGPQGEWYGKDLSEIQQVPLGLAPVPPKDSLLRWSVLQAGPGRAELISDPADPTTVVLKGSQPGAVTVKLEARLGEKTFSATRRFTIGPLDVPAGQTIAADGTYGVAESIAGTTADSAYSPEDLVTVSDPMLQVAVPGSNRMQANTAVCFGRLLSALFRYGRDSATVRLVSGWSEGGTGLDGIGRALSLAPAAGSKLTVERLAAAAHCAGFDYVQNTGTVVRVAQRAGAHMAVSGPAEVTVGATASIGLPRFDNPVDAVLARDTICVVNQGTSTVSLLNQYTGALRATVSVGPNPVGIAVSADGQTVFTASETNRTITAITVSTGATVTSSVLLPEAPVAIASHPNQPRVVVLMPTKVFTIATNGLLAIDKQIQIPASNIGKLLAVNPSGNLVWVACADRMLRCLDLERETWRTTVALDFPPTALAAGSSNVYMAGGTQLTIVDSANGTMIRNSKDTDASPTRIALDEKIGALYLAGGATRRIERRTILGELVNATTVPGIPVSLSIPSGQEVLVALRGRVERDQSDAVAVVSNAKHTVTSLWPLLSPSDGRRDWSLHAADSATAHLDGNGGDLTVLTAEKAGAVDIQVRSRVDGNGPYTVHVSLDPQLLADPTVIVGRTQYELIMNVLNELHPIGVEFEVADIRSRVPDLKPDQAELYPYYTYPTYRLRGRHLARLTKKD
ncbi:LamG-like jellyroll fold domain-containing protein [Nocardia sp. NPDC049149]|uniref:LamG-like jellyroll fold domain-containing protein n=1 Tax=Nocardia sp. NPDC049149 TaxID=3364315 RepID=UPI0037141145